MYKSIVIDRENLTIMGVRFADLETLNNVADALGSNMFEGFEPTAKLIELYRDYRTEKISNKLLIEKLKNSVIYQWNFYLNS
jgi:putative transcriptional regulator